MYMGQNMAQRHNFLYLFVFVFEFGRSRTDTGQRRSKHDAEHGSIQGHKTLSVETQLRIFHGGDVIGYIGHIRDQHCIGSPTYEVIIGFKWFSHSHVSHLNIVPRATQRSPTCIVKGFSRSKTHFGQNWIVAVPSLETIEWVSGGCFLTACLLPRHSPPDGLVRQTTEAEHLAGQQQTQTSDSTGGREHKMFTNKLLERKRDSYCEQPSFVVRLLIALWR